MTEEEYNEYADGEVQNKMDALVAAYIEKVTPYYATKENIEVTATQFRNIVVLVLNAMAKRGPVRTQDILAAFEDIMDIAVQNQIPMDKCQQQVIQ